LCRIRLPQKRECIYSLEYTIISKMENNVENDVYPM
jgi:hypothetical protein